ncbi:P-loop containing nucleoside triphosphate hydrolase protein [Pisolithus orientalis]|uniref:P-loop containing nucleoside triphosphate hydrolase protein n=1 Tax=Pisolithus orientalis TaxID=936130 RepID=UPI002224EDAA|nr:P-loop containing nucleoside triphosphate hydrolase protein [Pisolithus orientalis]KAI6025624.1 P-loop containing nucleoside triphosphate hydrolase protein [Pisolithus orientalis]
MPFDSTRDESERRTGEEEIQVIGQGIPLQSLRFQLDSGNEYVNYRRKLWQSWLPRNPPAPPPPSLEDAELTPLANASLFSRLTFSWITDIMELGYQRTLQASDLYKLDPSREAGPLSERLEAAWFKRVQAAADWNVRLESGEIRPSVLRRLVWAIIAIPSRMDRVDGKKAASLVWALNDVFEWSFWLGGVFKVLADTAQSMCPLVLKAIILFAEERSAARAAGAPLPNAGRGISMALGVWLLTIVTRVCSHQFFWRSMSTGVLARAALIASIYERGINLTGKERVKLTNAALVNYISTDVSRIDACAQWFHAAWTAPIQVAVCLIILLIELGPSALAGFSLFVLIIPLQQWMMALQHRTRLRSMIGTEQRTKVLLEVLGAMRVIKYFSYEVPYLRKLFELRKKELRGIRRIQFSTSAKFEISVLPNTVSELIPSDALSTAARRIDLSCTELAPSSTNDVHATRTFPDPGCRFRDPTAVTTQEYAVAVCDATFEWESPEKLNEVSDTLLSGRRSGARANRSPSPEGQGSHGGSHANAKEKDRLFKDAPVFKVRGITLNIPRGQLVAIVGPVGSGKSSLLQGIIGEMRKVSGHVSFGGRIAYCPQTAWIQNTTLRENVLFGQFFDEEKYWRVIESACLLPDLQLLPDSDLTEVFFTEFAAWIWLTYLRGKIGEKGINLSADQKQRVNIARALYHDPEIAIFDDPLSAVDAHVGKSLFEDIFVGSLRSRGITVVLVTHAIHFLPQVDYIYTISNGPIVESGTYQKRVMTDGEFAKLDRECGGRTEDIKGEGEEEEGSERSVLPPRIVTIEDVKLKAAQAREKATGKGKVEGLLIVKEQRRTGSVSLKVCLTLASVLGSVVVISVLVPYCFIGVVFVGIGYGYFAAFYRASAREVKRLDSMFRSLLYAHFSETFTGLPTIRSYGATKRFIMANRYYIDLEDRSLYLVITNQRWLSVRLDFMGAMLVFFVALLTVTDVSGINAAQIGLVLTYTLTLTQFASLMTRQSADVENNMNSIERIVQYTRKGTVPQEAPHEIPGNKPPPEWPRSGAVQFRDVQMSYRPGLPLVLKGVSLSIEGGEKIGVVGRTGAGKSSLMLTLYRIVELSSGSIVLDGIDISTLGLKDLRTKISIIPQDPLLFSGTIRSNLDPFSKYDDAKLWDALHRSCLIDPPSAKDGECESGEEMRTDRYTLDSTIESEGTNLSVGERSLLSLARALVKGCKVVVLDEATASVGLETDHKIQNTIKTEFRDCTLLCIAHRLRTIISYDCVLVMDAGMVAEFDTPYNLYQKEGGLFHGMCERSNITLKDIEASRCEKGEYREQ